MTTHLTTVIAVLGVLFGIAIGEVSLYASEIAVVALLLGVLQISAYIVLKKTIGGGKMTSDAVGVTRHFSLYLFTVLFSFGIFCGIVRSQFVEEKINFVCEKPCSFNARVSSSPETKNTFQIFHIEALLGDGKYNDIQIRTSLYPKYRIGDTLHISGKVTLPENIFPHENNNRTFDYVSYLQTKNIGSEMLYPSIEVIDGEAHTIPEVLGRWKENLITRIGMYVKEPASSLGGGMLFGANSMSDDLLQTFRNAGLSHIIVLSGFNIVIVISSVLFILTFLPLVLRVFFASLFVVIFVMMVGATPSVIRATLMAFISLLSLLLGRPYVAKQALILSLFAIVMYEPYSLMHDVSLHLSFLATMGLVYMSEIFETYLKKYLTSFSSLLEILITTFSAYFATLPYVMYAFGTVSLYAVVANIFVLPFVPVTMLLSFLVVLFSYFSTILSSLFGLVDTFLINVMIWIAECVSSLPFSKINISLSFPMMIFLYLIIAMIMYLLSIKQKDETGATDKNGNLTDVISY